MMKYCHKGGPLYKIGERIGFLIGLLVFCSIVFFIVTKAGGNVYKIGYWPFIIVIFILFIAYILIKSTFR